MPLELTDERWRELPGSYGHSDDIVKILAEAIASKSLAGERLGDLINEVAHQGDASVAVYAVAPHLVELAGRTESQEQLDLLVHAGMLCANTGRIKAPRCPDFLLVDFQESAKTGKRMLAPLMGETMDFETFKYSVAALAGFSGHLELGRFLDGLELFEDQFHHPWFEQPLPAKD